MHQKILDLLLQEEEITWQSIIHDLVKSGELDPWDLDISLLAQKYLETIRKLQEANLFVSGKVILASAILLKIKSEKFLDEGFQTLNNLLFPPEDVEDPADFIDTKQSLLFENPQLTIKTPQARKKKVSVEDLITALERALEVNDRRMLRVAERQRIPADLIIPEKPIDITTLIREVYTRIKDFFVKKQTLTFTELIPSERKEDKVATFIPLLYLANQSKINLEQEIPFGEITIKLLTPE